MSTDKLVLAVGQATNRRGFLRKAGMSALGAAFLLLGLPGEAGATIQYRCCNLCQSPSSSCPPAGVTGCMWCWRCCDGGRSRQCCEFHKVGAPCDRSCTGVICSRTSLTTTAC